MIFRALQNSFSHFYHQAPETDLISLCSVLKNTTSVDLWFTSGWKNDFLMRVLLNFVGCVNQVTCSVTVGKVWQDWLKESDMMSWREMSVSATTSPETSYLDWSSQALVWFTVSRCRSLVFFFFPMVGACWSSLRSPEGSQLLLGGWRLHLQVFRGDSGRPLPQSHQA